MAYTEMRYSATDGITRRCYSATDGITRRCYCWAYRPPIFRVLFSLTFGMHYKRWCQTEQLCKPCLCNSFLWWYIVVASNHYMQCSWQHCVVDLWGWIVVASNHYMQCSWQYCDPINAVEGVLYIGWKRHFDFYVKKTIIDVITMYCSCGTMALNNFITN